MTMEELKAAGKQATSQYEKLAAGKQRLEEQDGLIQERLLRVQAMIEVRWKEDMRSTELDADLLFLILLL